MSLEETNAGRVLLRELYDKYGTRDAATLLEAVILEPGVMEALGIPKKSAIASHMARIGSHFGTHKPLTESVGAQVGRQISKIAGETKETPRLERDEDIRPCIAPDCPVSGLHGHPGLESLIVRYRVGVHVLRKNQCLIVMDENGKTEKCLQWNHRRTE